MPCRWWRSWCLHGYGHAFWSCQVAGEQDPDWRKSKSQVSKNKKILKKSIIRTVDKLLCNNYDSICIFIGCCKRMYYSHLTRPPTAHHLPTHLPTNLPTTYPLIHPPTQPPLTHLRTHPPHPPNHHPRINNHRIGNFPGVARASCFKETGGLLLGFTLKVNNGG